MQLVAATKDIAGRRNQKGTVEIPSAVARVVKGRTSENHGSMDLACQTGDPLRCRPCCLKEKGSRALRPDHEIHPAGRGLAGKTFIDQDGLFHKSRIPLDSLVNVALNQCHLQGNTRLRLTKPVRPV